LHIGPFIMIDDLQRLRKDTVLLVSLGTVFGGAETYYVKLAKILLEQHTLVAVVCDRTLKEELESLGIEVVFVEENYVGLSRYLQAYKLCRRIIRKYGARLCHLNGQPENYLAPFLRLSGIRILSTRHTPFSDLFLAEGSGLPILLKRWMVLLCLRSVAKTVCVSQLLYRQLNAYISGEKLTYIPTWVEEQFLEVRERPAPRLPLRALFVGRVVAHKGIWDLIEAMSLCTNVELTVVGEGDELREARLRAATLPVTFQGFLQDCRPAYHAADLIVFTSIEGFEGLPQVPLEAMAMGIPCLASNISSVKELASQEDSAMGLPLAMYEQGNAADLARNLEKLAADFSELQRLSVAGRVQVLRHFTTDAIRDTYLTTFATD
jgi:glycosyltransferase involved in cell wall biosynthesis